MGILSFLKDAGEKIFTFHPSQKEEDLQKKANRKAEVEISIFNYLAKNKLHAKDLSVTFDEASNRVIVKGVAPDQVTREKIILCCGNINGVESVEDALEVENSQAPSQWYTVSSGDTLSKIAQDFYGDARKYPIIFEANQPMLSHPDRIYPGQVLRIPVLS